MSWPAANWPTQQAAVATAVPPGMQYTPEQWAQMQQQNWQQWAQWQQQYQQWQQQYGAEYQKSIGALSGTQPPLPIVPTFDGPPPLPAEPKPPLPPEDPPIEPTHTTSNVAYTTAPPPNLGYTTAPPIPVVPTVPIVPTVVNPPLLNNPPPPVQQTWNTNKRPYSQSNDFDPNKRQMTERGWSQWGSRPDTSQAPPNFPQRQTPNYSQPPPKPTNVEELTEAEKKFDKEFAAWEAQFNKWKEQNANHPDKSQYREYEKKWESWRNSLLERREQMRRKRLNLVGNRGGGVASPVQKPPIDNQMFHKPPPSFKPNPAMNNAPLSFKPAQEFPGEVLDTKEGFLSSSNTGGIPGLDLVKDGDIEDYDDPGKLEIIELDKEETPKKSEPDFEAISKGINSILGDQKLLSMLSMVAKNQAPKSEVAQEVPQINEHSSQSFEERSMHGGEGFMPRESVNNFDDQTRSSFTMGPSDQFDRNRGGFNNEGRGNNGFGNNRNSFSGSFNQEYDERMRNDGPNRNDSFNRNDGFNRNDSFNRNDNFNRSDSFNRGDNFNRNDSFNRGDNFNRNDNFNRGDNRNDRRDNFNRGDNYNRGDNRNDSFNRSDNFNRGDNRNDNFNRSDNFNRFDNRKDNFNNRNNNYNQNNDYYEDQEQENYDEENYNENEDFDKYHEWFNEDQQEPPQNQEVVVEAVVEDDEAIFEPASVIDYDHKPLKKPDDIEILLEPIHMFDYRHKPLKRIPIPQRPQWLNSSVRNMREFDPLAAVPFDRSFMPPRYQPNWNEREPNRRNRYDEGRVRDRNRFVVPEERKIQHTEEPPAKLDLEELSDDDMEWDEGKTAKKEQTIEEVPPAPAPAFNNTTMIEEILNAPGRYKRAAKIVIILRGPPGSGKTYLAKLIKDKEVELGGSAPRILSLDDYFMVEHEKEVIEDGKVTKVKEMIYEYEKEMEESYRQSLLKSFRKTVTDGYFPFIIVDNVNDKVKNFGEMWSFAKRNGFQVYVCQLDLDPQVCASRNIHGRTEKEIEDCVAGWEPTPNHHPSIDASGLLQSTNIQEVEMEEMPNEEEKKPEEEEEAAEDHVRSKWDNFDCSSNNLAKLDGVSKPLRPSRTMEEYLQLEEQQWSPPRSSKPGKKRVRWADLEQQKQQAKMKALGFVVGHNNWGQIMETTAESALTQTKYIDRVRKF